MWSKLFQNFYIRICLTCVSWSFLPPLFRLCFAQQEFNARCVKQFNGFTLTFGGLLLPQIFQLIHLFVVLHLCCCCCCCFFLLFGFAFRRSRSRSRCRCAGANNVTSMRACACAVYARALVHSCWHGSQGVPSAHAFAHSIQQLIIAFITLESKN